MSSYTRAQTVTMVASRTDPSALHSQIGGVYADDRARVPLPDASDALPTVEIVALSDILIHEVHDPKRAAPLVDALQRDGMQRHPVILARNPGGPLVHLDGANRLAALQQLNCLHVAAQVLDYADPHAVSLDVWLHLAPMTEHELLRAARAWKRTLLVKQPPAAALNTLQQGNTTAVIIFDNGNAYQLVAGKELAERVDAMGQLSELYADVTEREILPPGETLTGIRSLLRQHPQAHACVIFAPLTKTDVLTVAWKLGVRLPAGITRHEISCGRVLGVNVPLSLLQANLPTSNKTLQLQTLLATRRQRRYVEPTLVYEEY